MTQDFNILHINDQAVTLVTADGQYSSPGFALYQDKWLTLGQEAEQKARLFPRASHNQFWQQLSLERLTNASALVSHTADLVYHQLKQLFEQAPLNPLIILVPGYLNEERISLLLGICSSLNQTVTGVIDPALLIGSHQSTGSLWYLDLHLHQCLLTQIAVNPAKIEKIQTVVIANCGINQLKELWIQAISDEFIQQTRFNPRHTGEHEQQLYNQIPQWLAALKQGETQIQVADKSITIGFNLLTQISKRLLQTIEQTLQDYGVSASDSKTVLSPHSKILAEVSPIFAPWQQLEHKTLADYVHHNYWQLVDEKNAEAVLFPEYLLTTSTTKTQQQTQAPPLSTKTDQNKPAEVDELSPTHLLINDCAYAINESWLAEDENLPLNHAPKVNALCRLYYSSQGATIEPLASGCLLNGIALTKLQRVQIGDVIATSDIDSYQYRLIRVVANGSE